MQATLGPFGFEQAVKTRQSAPSMYVAVAAHVIVLLALFRPSRGVWRNTRMVRSSCRRWTPRPSPFP